MNLEVFNKLNFELKDFTNELAYHIVGDPLVLSNLKEYLNTSLKHNLKVNITTAGNNINKSHYETLLNPIIKQINFSINSYNANTHKKSLDDYLEAIIDFVKFAQAKKHEFFINFRIWNLDEEQSAKKFNLKVFKKINESFNVFIDSDQVYADKPKNIRIAKKLFFHFDKYFDWPSLNSKVISKSGFCYGLDSHFGILANGDVVPCCLDKDAIVKLGNININSLTDILSSKKAISIKENFKKNILIEELCQKCDYRTRFNKG